MKTTRQPEVISGALRENVERLKRRLAEPSFSVERLQQLLDELDEALIVRQMEASLKLVGSK
jgi:hypothetical protein